MIINLPNIYKKIISTIIKRKYKIQLRKEELDMIEYKGVNLEKDLLSMETFLIKNKRIKISRYEKFKNYARRAGRFILE